MKLYIYVVDGAAQSWGLTDFNVRAALSEQNISAPENPAVFAELDLSEFGYFEFHTSPFPSHNAETQSVTEAAPALIDGQWAQQWTVAPLSADLIAQNMANAKAAKNLQINQWRAEANQSTFTYQGKKIACDALSRSDIDAVAGSVSMNNAFPVGFPNAWKATDNTLIMIPDIATFKAMYNAMTQQGTINFGHSQSLKAALAAANTIEEINAITWG